MNIHKASGGWEYWYDGTTVGGRVWWAMKVDGEGNQIGEAIHAPTKDYIKEAINNEVSKDFFKSLWEK